MTLLVRRNGLPTPPVEIADEVEMWARQHGRHATLHFVPTLISDRRQVLAGTWLVRITLRADDRRMQLFQKGLVSEPPTEDVWLHVPDDSMRSGYRPLDLLQMGASGVKEFLEKGDTWSGRGQFRSLEEQVRQIRQENADLREKTHANARENTRLEQREKRRWRFKIPFLPVKVDLKAALAHVTPDLGRVATTKEKSV